MHHLFKLINFTGTAWFSTDLLVFFLQAPTTQQKGNISAPTLSCPGNPNCSFRTSWRHDLLSHLTQCRIGHNSIKPLSVGDYASQLFGVKFPRKLGQLVSESLAPRKRSAPTKKKSPQTRQSSVAIRNALCRLPIPTATPVTMPMMTRVPHSNSWMYLGPVQAIPGHVYRGPLVRPPAHTSPLPANVSTALPARPPVPEPAVISEPLNLSKKTKEGAAPGPRRQVANPPPAQTAKSSAPLADSIPNSHPAGVPPSYVCGHCSFSTISQMDMTHHIVSKHPTECPSPAASQGTSSPLGTTLSNGNSKAFSCNHCTFRANLEVCMVKHLLMMHKEKLLPARELSGEVPFTCPYCTFTSEQEAMVPHMLDHYQGEKQCGDCEVCQMEKSLTIQLKSPETPLETSNQTKSPGHVVPPSQTTEQTPRRKISEKGASPKAVKSKPDSPVTSKATNGHLECTFCNKTFPNPNALRFHIYSIHSEPEHNSPIQDKTPKKMQEEMEVTTTPPPSKRKKTKRHLFIKIRRNENGDYCSLAAESETERHSSENDTADECPIQKVVSLSLPISLDLTKLKVSEEVSSSRKQLFPKPADKSLAASPLTDSSEKLASNFPSPTTNSAGLVFTPPWSNNASKSTRSGSNKLEALTSKLMQRLASEKGEGILSEIVSSADIPGSSDDPMERQGETELDTSGSEEVNDNSCSRRTPSKQLLAAKSMSGLSGMFTPYFTMPLCNHAITVSRIKYVL